VKADPRVELLADVADQRVRVWLGYLLGLSPEDVTRVADCGSPIPGATPPQ
jgi:hypothetical protein